MMDGTEGQEQGTLRGKNKANNGGMRTVKSCIATQHTAIQATGRRALKGIASTPAEGDPICGKGWRMTSAS